MDITEIPCDQARREVLIAICDALCYRALEMVGKRIVRTDRARFTRMGNRSWYLAHTLWRPEEKMVSKALAGAWDIVPTLLDNYECDGLGADRVIDMLDAYVHDLLITGTQHTPEQLRYRFENMEIRS